MSADASRRISGGDRPRRRLHPDDFVAVEARVPERQSRLACARLPHSGLVEPVAIRELDSRTSHRTAFSKTVNAVHVFRGSPALNSQTSGRCILFETTKHTKHTKCTKSPPPVEQRMESGACCQRPRSYRRRRCPPANGRRSSHCQRHAAPCWRFATVAARPSRCWPMTARGSGYAKNGVPPVDSTGGPREQQVNRSPHTNSMCCQGNAEEQPGTMICFGNRSWEES